MLKISLDRSFWIYYNSAHEGPERDEFDDHRRVGALFKGYPPDDLRVAQVQQDPRDQARRAVAVQEG